LRKDNLLRHDSEKLSEEFLMSTSFIEHFSQLRDPRVERNKLYPLMEILLLAVCAMLSAAEGWEAMEEFGKAKLDWLRKFAPFANVLFLTLIRVSPALLDNAVPPVERRLG